MFARRVTIHGAAERSAHAMQTTLSQVAGDVQALKAAAGRPEAQVAGPPATPEEPPPAQPAIPAESGAGASNQAPPAVPAQPPPAPAPPAQFASPWAGPERPPTPPVATRARAEEPRDMGQARERGRAPAAPFPPLLHRLAGAWQQLMRPPPAVPASAASPARSEQETPVLARLPRPRSLSPEFEQLARALTQHQEETLQSLRTLTRTVSRQQYDMEAMRRQISQMEARARQ